MKSLFILMFIAVFTTTFILLKILQPKMKLWIRLSISLLTGLVAISKFFLLFLIIPGIPPL